MYLFLLTCFNYDHSCMEMHTHTYVYMILQSNKDMEVVNSFMGETK